MHRLFCSERRRPRPWTLLVALALVAGVPEISGGMFGAVAGSTVIENAGNVADIEPSVTVIVISG